MAPKYRTLAEYLDETGTTQSALGARVGVKQSVISKIARGIQPAGGGLALRLEKETGVPIEALLNPPRHEAAA
jgi:transcriptional regulator with XRE-family HTH domain